MNHEEENELFNRLEADMTADPGGEILSLDKARAARQAPASAEADQEGGPVEVVDGPEPSGPGLLERIKGAKRIDIFPVWMKSVAEFKDAAGWLGGHIGHTIAFHTVRSPLYAAKLAARSPQGAGRLVGGRMRWVADVESEPLRQAAATREDAEEYLKLTRQRDRRVRWRGTVAAVTIPALLALTLYLVFGAPVWLQLAALAVMVGWCGILGAPADKPLSTRAVVKTEVQKLTSDMVVKAMAAIGITQISSAVAKGQEGVRFVSPIHRDGPGWRADIDLPLGVTPGDVVDRRSRLASGLRRPLGCVWPDSDPNEHEGRLVLWVGDRDLSKTGTVAWPLAKDGRHDIFRPIPFGLDPRGRLQSVPIVQHNVLVGSLPGQGKTSSVRILACGAALDPSVELWLHENKGTGDFDALEPVAHRFVSGIDDESIRYAADSLTLLRAEVMRRAAAIKRLPRDLCPDKRVTRTIADKRSLKLWPLLAVFDECQNLFAHAKYGKQAGEDAEFIIKLGRALGVILVLATQRPDKDSLPTGVSGNVSIRFCLKVAGQVENDMILGTSAYKNGVRATMFRPEIDAGIGYLAGANPMPTVVKTAYLDGPATARIAERALKLRKTAGTLTGHALGEEAETAAGPAYDLLADILAVLHADEDKVWNERIAARLAELRPQVYAGWKGENVTAALKPHGVKTKDIAGNTDDGTRTTRRGIDRTAIESAIAERDENTGAA